jgi:hypothetical protein
MFPVYLKSSVENNIINSTEVCVNLKNGEVCLDGDEWVENDSDGTLTKKSLQQKLNQVASASCSIQNNTAVRCSLYTEATSVDIYAYPDGKVSIVLYNSLYPNEYSCSVFSNGSSYCELPPDKVDVLSKNLIISNELIIDSDNIPGSLYGLNIQVVPEDHMDDLDSFLSYNEYLFIFLLHRANKGFDPCFYAVNKTTCISELLEDTPGSSNVTLTSSMIKNKLENRYDYTVISKIENIEYYDQDAVVLSFVVPYERAANHYNGKEIRITFVQNKMYQEVSNWWLDDEFHSYNWSGSCAFDTDGYGDYWTCYWN